MNQPENVSASVNAGSLHRGASVRCPHCGRESIVVIRAEFDGWKRVGDVFACGLCDTVLGQVPGVSTSKDDAVDTEQSKRAKQLLGFDERGSQELSAAKVLGEDTEHGPRHFCRDCRHYLVHPFLSRCLLHNRTVEPMGDCPDFCERDTDEDVK